MISAATTRKMVLTWTVALGTMAVVFMCLAITARITLELCLCHIIIAMTVITNPVCTATP